MVECPVERPVEDSFMQMSVEGSADWLSGGIVGFCFGFIHAELDVFLIFRL